MAGKGSTHKQKVLDLLRDGRPHTHLELYRLGCVAHSRISDLRRDGHRIDTWRDGDNYLYQLRSSLDETQTASSMAPTLPAVLPSKVCVSSNEDLSSNPRTLSGGTDADDQHRSMTRDGGQVLVLFSASPYWGDAA